MTILYFKTWSKFTYRKTIGESESSHSKFLNGLHNISQRKLQKFLQRSVIFGCFSTVVQTIVDNFLLPFFQTFHANGCFLPPLDKPGCMWSKCDNKFESALGDSYSNKLKTIFLARYQIFSLTESSEIFSCQLSLGLTCHLWLEYLIRRKSYTLFSIRQTQVTYECFDFRATTSFRSEFFCSEI